VGTPPPDGGPTSGGETLVLTTSVSPATLALLTIDSGTIALTNTSLFGDVAPDSRTTVSRVSMRVTGDSVATTYAVAPYGLYSRMQAWLDDLHIHGTWRGAPLSIDAESDRSTIDLPGPTLDYEPGQSAHFIASTDVDAWLDPAVLDGATGSPDGSIQIDELHNRSAAIAIATAARASFTLTAAGPSTP
jgi:hypothetical protein